MNHNVLPSSAPSCSPGSRRCGSTLIACHRAGRTARLIELDPGYCDVILRRYAEHTGQVPTHATSGIPFELPAPE